MSAAGRVDSVAFFDHLAEHMNRHPELYRITGDADINMVVIMRKLDGDFRVRLDFSGLCCDGVAEISADDVSRADFALVGELEAWQAMFDDIVTNGRATGPFTINSLALMGDRISCTGDDPMGLDKFSRFNQTIQGFFDGAASVTAGAGSVGS